jgi:hypothetical protein
MGAVNWATAGKRLKVSPREHGRNADWNDRLSRWKTAEEYAGETLDVWGVFNKVECPICAAPIGVPCIDARAAEMDGPHAERRAAAGAALIAEGWKL